MPCIALVHGWHVLLLLLTRASEANNEGIEQRAARNAVVALCWISAFLFGVSQRLFPCGHTHPESSTTHHAVRHQRCHHACYSLLIDV